MGVSKLRSVVENAYIQDYSWICEKNWASSFSDIQRVIIDVSIFIRDFLCPSKTSIDIPKFFDWVNTLELYGVQLVFAFDGPACIQKLKEQCSRRFYNTTVKKLVGTVPFLKMSAFSQTYTNILSHIETALIARGHVVLSHQVPGEADHKIFEFLRSAPFITTFIMSNDWDLYIRAVSYTIDNPMHKVLYANRTQVFDPKTHANLEWFQLVMIFGCDYYPGIGNFKLFKVLVEMLDNSVTWIIKTNGVYYVDQQKLKRWISNNETTFASVGSIVSTMYPIESEESFIIDVRRYQEKLNKKKTVPEDLLEEREALSQRFQKMFFACETCSGTCTLCSESTGDTKLHPDRLYETFIKILEWTINHYFNIAPNTPEHSIVYPYGSGPDVTGLLLSLIHI